MENKVEVLKFSATWCGPCRVLAKNLEGIKEVKNIDVNENMELAAKFGVRNLPLLVFMDGDKELGRSSGVISKEQYEELINKYKLNQ
jgi:thioredoxin 1